MPPLLVVGSAFALPVCPNTSINNTDCGYLLTIGAGGSITGAAVAGANPYDGSDDALVGIINNSGAMFSGSFSKQGSRNGGGIFAFDGDGICAYVNASYCSTAATGYEGPLVTFTNIHTTSVFADFGTIVVNGLAAGYNVLFAGRVSCINQPNHFARTGLNGPFRCWCVGSPLCRKEENTARAPFIVRIRSVISG